MNVSPPTRPLDTWVKSEAASLHTRGGGIAAVILGFLLLLPPLFYGVLLPSFGLDTRADFASFANIQAHWPLLMLSPLLQLGFALGFMSVSVALYERLVTSRRSLSRFSMGLLFLGGFSAFLEAIRDGVAYLPISLTDTKPTEQYEFVLRLMLNNLEPIFIYGMVFASGIATAIWGYTALKGKTLPKALSWTAFIGGILATILFPLYNIVFAIVYLWLGIVLLQRHSRRA